MPRGDRTGPWGGGPRTGRNLGYCTGFSSPGYMKGMGMGWGRGRGYGRGGWNRWGRGRNNGPFHFPLYASDEKQTWPFTPTPEKESEYLKELVSNMKEEIKMLEKRITELSEQSKE